MNVDPLRLYAYLEKTRALVFDRVRGLNEEQYTRAFAIGPGSIARTLTHVMVSEWYYVQRMLGRDVPPYENWPVNEERPPAAAELERLWTNQSDETRRAIASIPDWNARLSYRVTTDEGKRIMVTATPADQFTQLVIHEVHHRAQVANMLRQLGAASLGDLDYNWMMFERKEVP